MTQGHDHSYLDLSVLPKLRNRVLSPDAVVLFHEDLGRILWANAAGAKLFGGHGVVDLLATPLSDNQSFVRQLRECIDQLKDAKKITRGFRINLGGKSRLLQFEIRRIKLPGDDSGFMVSSKARKKNRNRDESLLAKDAVKSLTGFADAAAILDNRGLPLAKSKNFADIGPKDKALARIVKELKKEKDRLIKRPVINPEGNTIAIGMARLGGKPGRNLIVLAETEQHTKTAAPQQEMPEDEAPLESEHNTPLEKNIPEISSDEIKEPDVVEEKITSGDTDTEISTDIENQSEAEALVISTLEEIPTSAKSTEFAFDNDAEAIRFAWTINENGIFQSVSPELAAAVGPNAANIEGRSWTDVAAVFGFDSSGNIGDLLAKRDTWSGKTVLWPVQGTDMVVPVDLAALPVFGAERSFEGFRGFGIVRTADAILDPDETGLALVSSAKAKQAPELPDEPEYRLQNDIEDEDTASDQTSNVIKLAPRDLPPTREELTEKESTAFKVIGEKLRKEIPTIAESDSNIEPEVVEVPAIDTSLMENIPVAILVYRSGETLFANQKLLETTGYGTIEDLREAGGVDAILNTTDEMADEQYLTSQTGEKIHINPVLQTVPWAGEKALMLSFPPETPATIDVPPAIEISKASEVQAILDTASDGIILTETDGEILSINASAEALFGKSFDDTKGMMLTELFANESRETIKQYVTGFSEPGISNLLNDGQEVIGQEANGGMIPIFLTISTMETSGKLCAVIRDMTSWKKAEEELINSRRKAEEASEQKSDFLAHVSHEIRTPLNAIIGFSDVMIEERFGMIENERYREYLRDINRSGNHVLELINDLLDLSKIEAGKLELAFEAVDLNQLVAETVALLQPQANNNRIIIRTSLSRAVPKVVADTRSMRQIILNLVSNAIKYSTANSQVIVSTVYESNGEVALRVRDTGQGMSKLEIEDAMKPFHQVHGISDKKGAGTGLGLPLTKALVEANRAHFDLESEPENGTIAHVHFPMQRVLAD